MGKAFAPHDMNEEVDLIGIMEHVTFVPKGMSPEKLQEGFEWLNSSFLSWGSILRRLFKVHRSVQIFGPMNLGFRKAWKKRNKSKIDRRETPLKI